MTTHTLLRKQTFDHSIESVFKFFQSPDNLVRITPPWLNFRIITPLPIRMRRGALIDYTINWLGWPIRWRTMIMNYEPPITFVDQQIKGPYSLWHHTHTFVKNGDRTEMTDVVRYMLPFGIFGNVAHSLMVRHQLNKIFDYREQVIAEFFPSRNGYPHDTIMKELSK